MVPGRHRAADALHPRRDPRRKPRLAPALDHRARHLPLPGQDPRRGRHRHGASHQHAARADQGRPELRADRGLSRLRGGHRSRRGAGQPAGGPGHLSGLRREGHLLPAGHEAAGPRLPGKRWRVPSRRGHHRRWARGRDGRRAHPPGCLPRRTGSLSCRRPRRCPGGHVRARPPAGVHPLHPADGADPVGHDRPLGPGAHARTRPRAVRKLRPRHGCGLCQPRRRGGLARPQPAGRAPDPARPRPDGHRVRRARPVDVRPVRPAGAALVAGTASAPRRPTVDRSREPRSSGSARPSSSGPA